MRRRPSRTALVQIPVAACALSLLVACSSSKPAATASSPTTSASTSSSSTGAPSSAPSASASTAASTPASAGDITALEAAAKKEGSLTWYTSIPQAIATSEATAFKTKYGVTVTPIVLTSGLLETRFSSEKDAGNSGADVLSVADSIFMKSAATKKWLAALSTTELPSLAALDPKYILSSSFVLTGLQPIGISYDTSKLKASQLATWQDLLSPSLKGQIYLVDPTNVPSWLAEMDLLRKTYGDSYLKSLAANGPQFVDSSVPGAQQVAAGSGQVVFPSLLSVSNPLKAKGATIDTVFPSPTTGVEEDTAISSTAPHPSAAKLFLNFVMSMDGQVIFNAGTAASPLGALPGTLTQPAGYQSFDLATAEADKATILSLLGK
jgi:iron(III) transport system substrate-binding protein